MYPWLLWSSAINCSNLILSLSSRYNDFVDSVFSPPSLINSLFDVHLHISHFILDHFDHIFHRLSPIVVHHSSISNLFQISSPSLKLSNLSSNFRIWYLSPSNRCFSWISLVKFSLNISAIVCSNTPTLCNKTSYRQLDIQIFWGPL